MGNGPILPSFLKITRALPVYWSIDPLGHESKAVLPSPMVLTMKSPQAPILVIMMLLSPLPLAAEERNPQLMDSDVSSEGSHSTKDNKVSSDGYSPTQTGEAKDEECE